MPVPLLVLAAALLMIAAERLRPGRRFPRVAGWWPRALSGNALQAAVVLLAGVAWDGWMLEQRPWPADSLGLVAGPLLGYLAITFIYYWWHRARHQVPCLWRWFHQLHHSPQRIEIVTSFYKHPLELVANSLLSSAILYWLVGLGPAAAAITVLLTGVAELFYHWNVRTPHWLGPIFQRPEMHCVHHQQGVHAYNYADLPLWDLLFGTYCNPRRFDERCGLGPTVEHRVADLLLGRDLSTAGDPVTARAPDAGRDSTTDGGGAARNTGLAAGVAGRFVVGALLALGLLQMGADLLQLPRLKGLAAATAASPAPKVFSSARGLETYSSRFLLEWEDAAGRHHARAITPERYSQLAGPYNRRNAYGAAVAYAPVLAADERTRPLFEGVAHHGLCGDAPLLRELGVDARGRRGPFRLRVEPRAGTRPEGLPLVLEVACS